MKIIYCLSFIDYTVIAFCIMFDLSVRKNLFDQWHSPSQVFIAQSDPTASNTLWAALCQLATAIAVVEYK